MTKKELETIKNFAKSEIDYLVSMNDEVSYAKKVAIIHFSEELIKKLTTKA